MEYKKAAGNSAAFHWVESLDSIPLIFFIELLSFLTAIGSTTVPVPGNAKLVLLKSRENILTR